MTADDMIEFIGENFIVIVVTMFVLFAIAEMVIPLRRNRLPLTFRWFTNLALTALIVLIYRLLEPLIALASASASERLGLGLLNQYDPGLPLVLLLGVAVLDLKQYLFHRLVHYYDWLWRIHQVHHSDLELDLTTGFRFHPGEALLSAALDILVIAVFGLPVEVIVLRFLLVYFANFFTHANCYLPPVVDRALRVVFVTPAMHHLHHALNRTAANRNFGVFFSFWDRIFGSYLERHPETNAGADGRDYVYGLREYREPRKLNLLLLMEMPFRAPQADAGQPPADPRPDAPGQGN